MVGEKKYRIKAKSNLDFEGWYIIILIILGSIQFIDKYCIQLKQNYLMK